MRARTLLRLCACLLAPGAGVAGAPAVGVLQPDPARASELAAAGVSRVVFSVSWDRLEPAPDAIDPACVEKLRAELAAYREAGLKPVLDLGIQYPPGWLRAMPGARYQNQHGDPYSDPRPGMDVVNSVFSQEIRTRQARHLAAVFRELGDDWAAVRLGGGWYGELNYPPAVFAGKTNCYWAFDPIAQGSEPGLPDGVAPCPVPGWKPGDSSAGHEAARRFADWYLDSLKNYHDWQIATVRRHYDGPLLMMYPSWGVRPGQLDAAVAGNLSGRTTAEKNGEIQRGFDFARFIGGIRDPLVWVHCTWIDADPAWSDEASADPARWSPPRFLAHLARAHRPALRVSAENTGGGGMAALELSAARVRALELDAFYWAFAPDLFDGRPPVLADLRVVFQKCPRSVSFVRWRSPSLRS